MKTFNFNEFVAKAEETKTDDLLKKIKGGTNDNCHDGEGKTTVFLMWGLIYFRY